MEELIYAYLINHCIGYKNRVKGNVLQKQFGIKDNKTFRRIIDNIRRNENYRYAVMSKSNYQGGYWIATTQEEIDAVAGDFKRRAKYIESTGEVISNKEYLGKQ